MLARFTLASSFGMRADAVAFLPGMVLAVVLPVTMWLRLDEDFKVFTG
jgi:hypothetical protein